MVTPNLPEAAALTGASARAQRERNGSAGARNPGARRAQCADQRRARRRRRERRSAGRAGRGGAAFRQAHRHPKYARHRLHAILGDRCRARQRPRSRRRRAQEAKTLCHRRHRRRRSACMSATAPGRSTISTRNGESHDHAPQIHRRRHRCRRHSGRAGYRACANR